MGNNGQSGRRPAPPSETSRQIVLLVDDEPEALGFLIQELEGAGLTALVARSGESALDLLGRIEPDLILLDAMMPGLSGFETCRRIKQSPELSLTPVVFMTGLSDTEHVLEGLQAGGVDYIAKPINAEELIARIAVHIANARMVREARSALDAGGRSAAAFYPPSAQSNCALAWASPRAAELLGANLEQISADAQRHMQDWLTASADQPVSLTSELTIARHDGTSVRLTMLGRSGGGDLLVRVDKSSDEEPVAKLSAELGLSNREAEVLSWLASGKSNRDIAAILELSPRTVTKHVEQVLQKLGVDNRTAAAGVAIRLLSR